MTRARPAKNIRKQMSFAGWFGFVAESQTKSSPLISSPIQFISSEMEQRNKIKASSKQFVEESEQTVLKTPSHKTK